jgi:DNA damage-binding protein 1
MTQLINVRIRLGVRPCAYIATKGLSTFACKETEEVYSISTVSLHDGLEDRSFFAVGTVFVNDTEVEPSRGRVLIFSVSPRDSAAGTHSRGSWLLTSGDVSGCVYALACTEGLLLAAVNSAVSSFSFKFLHKDMT